MIVARTALATSLAENRSALITTIKIVAWRHHSIVLIAYCMGNSNGGLGIMLLNRNFVVGALFGALCAAGGAGALIAETAEPAAYVVIQTEDLKADANPRFSEMLASTLMSFKGRAFAQEAKPVDLDASETSNTPPDAPNVGISIIAFDRMTDLKAWWNSPFRKPLFETREKVSKLRVFAVDGRKPF